MPCGLETLTASQVSYPASRRTLLPFSTMPMCAHRRTRPCAVRISYSVVKCLGLVGEMGHRVRREGSPLKAVGCFLTESMLQNRRSNQNIGASNTRDLSRPACVSTQQHSIAERAAMWRSGSGVSRNGYPHCLCCPVHACRSASQHISCFQEYRRHIRTQCCGTLAGWRSP